MSLFLEQLAGALAAAQDVDAALGVANLALEAEQKTTFVLLSYDGRRNVVFNRGAARPTERVTGGAQVAIDHLPVNVRQMLQRGDRFVDVGDQSYQYAQLFKLPVLSEESRLFLRGMVIDESMCAVVAACDERRWGGGRRLDRLEAVGTLFSLAFARLYERDARFEAVAALQDLTRKLHDGHLERLAELEREIVRLRTARGDVIDQKRAEQLKAAAANAKRRASSAEQRLASIEHQVAGAVERLERAHIQIHRQNEKLREQAEMIQQYDEQLAQAPIVSLRTTVRV